MTTSFDFLLVLNIFILVASDCLLSSIILLESLVWYSIHSWMTLFYSFLIRFFEAEICWIIDF